MKRRFCCLFVWIALTGCDSQSPASDLTIERLPDVNPSLPEVPTLPPPPFETRYQDSSYSIYGIRRMAATTMDSELAVTGYIVAIYQPPECPEGRTCEPPSAPHMWIADTREAGGYAENQTQIDEAVELARRNRYVPPDPESGMLPIPTDFGIGAKVKVTGRFTRISGAGFNVSNGLLEYRGHTTIEPAPETEEAPTRR
jgi:hypothetical protein